MRKIKPKRTRKARSTEMIPNILKVLTNAIREKRCVAIRYHDQRHVRVVEPHVIYTHESGELVMDAFQTRGYSASGRPPPFWRPFRLKKITAVSPINESFETRLREGFTHSREKYRHGLVAIVDNHRLADEVPARALQQAAKSEVSRSKLYTQPQLEDVGPQLPKNPFRR
jgi:predicted DNA-binding transcriptional regulator YafY